MTEANDFTRMIRALQAPTAYPHPVERVEHRETHISHVLLAGEYAYKIKKPLDLGFLDFSSPAARAHYCHEEIRLNGRLAPQIYRAVVAITGTPEQPRIGGDGPVLEHAVCMRRFDDRHRLDHEIAAGGVGRTLIDAIGERIGRFHEELAASDPPPGCGTPESILGPAEENFEQIEATGIDAATTGDLASLRAWTQAQWQQLRPMFARRRRSGRVREGHGDLHLGNMVLDADAVAIFDGIEFNAELRWIDVANDIAFLVMDLDRVGAPHLAGRALDAWLAVTGDYEALTVLRFYLVYRAVVRAKIHALRAGQDPAAATDALAAYREYVALALRYAQAGAPAIVLTRGVAGTGKSSAAACLVERVGAVRLRSDVERRRLYPDAPPSVRYSEIASTAVHARLERLARTTAAAGWPAVVDATFLERRHRAPFLALARRLGVPTRILDLQTPPAVRDARIRARAARGGDPSEADPDVAAHQEQALEPLTPGEAAITLAVDNSGEHPHVPHTGLTHARGGPVVDGDA